MDRPEYAALLPRKAAFTLLELVTAILIVAILAVMLMPALAYIQGRAERAKCIGNLRSLHVAAALYLQDHRMWPQVKTSGASPTTIASAWLKIFAPYHLAQVNWICPTEQRLLHSPDLNDPENVRIDYASTPFDTNPTTPFRWATQPWFIESGNVHGNGNEIVFPDGHIEELNDLWKSLHPAPSAAAAAH